MTSLLSEPYHKICEVLIFPSKDPAKWWKETDNGKSMFRILDLIGYSSLVPCKVGYSWSGNCAVCASLQGWTADDVREWIPEFPI